MRRLAILTLATACRSVLGFEDPVVDDPCFRDDFEAGAIDPARWVAMDTQTQFDATLAVEAGQLVIATAPNQVAENGILTRAPIDFSDGAVEVEVNTQAPTFGVLETFFLVFTGPSTGYGIIARGTTLAGVEFVAGTTTPDETIAFDRALRFWRVRHDAAARVLELEASANQLDYVHVRTIVDQPAPTAVTPRLQAGVYMPLSDPGRTELAGIDSFNGHCR